ncbi:hypothetical protein ACFL6C_11015, partial [Myxococcota bacterium]
LKGLICEANGANMTQQGECCITSNDGTTCCDVNLDGDFSNCEPPQVNCSENDDCNVLNCPAYCTNAGECRCSNMCNNAGDCMALNCPAFCNANGNCQCKIPCTNNAGCAWIDKCPSVCGQAGYCVCTNECVGEGEVFEWENEDRCCSGLTPVGHAEYSAGDVTSRCFFPGTTLFVCTACGDGECSLGESPCNCIDDCGLCLPGERLQYICETGEMVPWCSCTQAEGWTCIDSPESQCGQIDCRQTNTCTDGYVCDPETGQCTRDCRVEHCNSQGCTAITCPPGEGCDDVMGLCVPDCLGEGGKFTDFNTEGKCCPGLVAVPDHFPDNGYCIGPNCPCHVCTPCGTDQGLCGDYENRCNCPQDCVGSSNCAAGQCEDVAGSYAVAGGDCPGTSGLSDMYEISQTDCGLVFHSVLETLLGSTGCIDHSVIYTSGGCSGSVSLNNISVTMYFTCPLANNQVADTCTVFLDDMID